MTDAEQWLADLEAKAKAATPGPWKMKKDCDESAHMQVWDSAGVVCETPLYGFEYPEQWENGRFIAAANPAAVLRLVGMVREYDNEILHMRTENERLKAELVGAIEVMERLLASKPGGVYFQKYQGGLQIALRSAQLALSAATYAATENHHD